MTHQHSDQTPFGPIPREPSAYRPTGHFCYRFKYRESPPITPAVIRTCIREGRLKNTSVRELYYLEAEVRGITWRLLVNVPDRRVVTAFAPEHHEQDASKGASV